MTCSWAWICAENIGEGQINLSSSIAWRIFLARSMWKLPESNIICTKYEQCPILEEATHNINVGEHEFIVCYLWIPVYLIGWLVQTHASSMATIVSLGSTKLTGLLMVGDFAR